jgi:hypothetical protein
MIMTVLVVVIGVVIPSFIGMTAMIIVVIVMVIMPTRVMGLDTDADTGPVRVRVTAGVNDAEHREEQRVKTEH